MPSDAVSKVARAIFSADGPNSGLFGFAKNTIGSLATLPGRAIKASEDLRTTGEYDPGPILEAAMLPLGTGAIAGVPVRAGETVLGAGGIRAYHASPHDFDKFSIGKVGAGEGSQLEGHGLYFSGTKKGVEPYQRMFTNDAYLHADGLPIPASEQSAREALQRNGYDVAKTIEEYRNTFGKRYDPDEFAEIVRPLENMLGRHVQGLPRKATTYEVNLNVKPNDLLDWDMPLTQQARSSALKSLAKEWGEDASTTTGRQLYDAFSQFPGQAPNSALARDVLMDAGVPGVKYNRPAGRNYVMFDDSLIDIMRKYGVSSAAALPPAVQMMMGGMADPPRAQQMGALGL